MSEWHLRAVTGIRTTYARFIDGLDRIVAYIDFDQWEDQASPAQYEWSVQDGSCGKVLESGHVDGDMSLAAAQAEADAAAARLFLGR